MTTLQSELVSMAGGRTSILVLFVLLAFVAEGLASDECMFYTIANTCCKNPSVYGSNTYSSCAVQNGVSFSHCRDEAETSHFCSQNKLPGIGVAHPLGMSNGMIVAAQIRVPDEQASASNARLFSSNEGWKPSEAYLLKHAATFTCFKTLTNVPKVIVPNAPVFVEVIFDRMKKISYLIIQSSGYWITVTGLADTDRRFVLSYRTPDGKNLVYGENALLAEVLICKGMFGNPQQQCRFSLRPFRARSVKVSGIDFSNQDRWRLEFGGTDYMEADHWWRFDLIKERNTNPFYPDERGNLPMMLDRAITDSFEAGTFGSYFGASKDFASVNCFINPVLCKDGMSVGFWVKETAGASDVIVAESAEDSKTGFRIFVQPDKSLKAQFVLESKKITCSGPTLVTAQWTHVIITYSLTGGVSFFINGDSVYNCQSYDSGSSTFLSSRLKIRVGTSTGSVLSVNDLKLWLFALDANDAKEEYSPGKGIKLARDENIKKASPKTCADAMALFGNSHRWYSIYPIHQSVILKCLQTGADSLFYIYPTQKTSFITKSMLPYSHTTTFEQSASDIASVISAAMSCSQSIYLRCRKVAVSDTTLVITGKNGALVSFTCSGTCNCLGTTAVVYTDTVVVSSKDDLPLKEVKATDTAITSNDDFLEVSVGPVKCSAGGTIYDSCASALADTNVDSGSFFIGQSARHEFHQRASFVVSVKCERLITGKIKTIITHADSNKLFKVDGYEDRGSYKKQIAYNQNMTNIARIIDASDSCRQFVDLYCHHSTLKDWTWLTDRRKQKMKYWAGGPSDGEGCACGIKRTCSNPGKLCNCESNDKVRRRDAGYVEKMSDLPLTSINVGETGHKIEYKEFKIGDIECFTSGTIYDSCASALAATNVDSGSFFIGQSARHEFHQRASFVVSVKCERLITGEIKTIITHADSNKLLTVDGFEAAGSFKKVIAYNQNITSIARIIDASEKCQQFLSTECRFSIVTDSCWSTNRAWQKMKYWAGGPSNGKGCACNAANTCPPSKICNCDANDGSWRIDDGLVTNKTDLPLTSVRMGDTGSSKEIHKVKIGDVECFTSTTIYDSCNSALAATKWTSGNFFIGQSGPPISAASVRCEVQNGEVKTTISHADSNKLFYVHGYEAAGSYKKVIAYNQNLASISSIIDASERCQQLMDIECYDSYMRDTSWLTNRAGQKMSYWAGGPAGGTGCACGISNSCIDSRYLCNCDANQRKHWRDSGFVTRKSDLPLTTINFGETGHPGEYKKFKIGDVECFASASTANTVKSNGCAPSFEHSGNTYTTCIDSYDSYGLWCKDPSGTKIYCSTTETKQDDRLSSPTAGCVFPFTYRDVVYNSCSIENSPVPWCSMTKTYGRKWRYCISSHARAHIDFTINPADSFEDWKLGSSCTTEANTGPCGDASAFSKPSEALTTSPNRLVFPVALTNTSTLDSRDSTCTPNSIKPGRSRSLTAVSFEIKDLTQPTALNEVTIALKSTVALTLYQATAFIYVVIPPDCRDPSYVLSCKYSNFAAGVHYGPVVWNINKQLTTAHYLKSPNLVKIVSPLLRIDPKCLFTIVIKWESIEEESASFEAQTVMKLLHQEKVAASYLYADSAVVAPGKPLIYNTRHFLPSFRCLQFWYHMQGSGVGTLSVVIKQKDHVQREILRIRGDQGTSWIRATVPIYSFLKKDGPLFNFAFIALREAEIGRSIAIDDISLLPEDCLLFPRAGNIAEGVTSSQIDTTHNAPASLAVDGRRSTFTHTSNKLNPWWRADFEKTEVIAAVRIMNRYDCCADRLSNIEVKVGNDTSDSVSNTLCNVHTNAVPAGETVEVTCSTPLYGRYVYVILKKTTHLTMCDVQIFRPTDDFNSIVAQIPKPLLLIPLDQTTKTLGEAHDGFITSLTKKIGVADKFGYPLLYSSFSTLATFTFTSSKTIDADFTISLHVKPTVLSTIKLISVPSQLTIEMDSLGKVKLSFQTLNSGMVEIQSNFSLVLNTWSYLSFSYTYHLATLKIFFDGKLAEERMIGYVKPSVTLSQVDIGDPGAMKTFITCIQIYAKSLDTSEIKALDLCPNRHVSDVCRGGCGIGICDQITGKCLCPSEANRFVSEKCELTLKTAAYKNATSYLSYDDQRVKKFPTFASAKNFSQLGLVPAGEKFFYAPGPVNTAKCTWTKESVDSSLPSQFCLTTATCPQGVAVSFWFYLAPVSDWSIASEITIVKFGPLNIKYGLIDDVRGCNRSRIKGLSISSQCFTSRCTWLTMLYGNMIEGVWSHIAISISPSNVLSLYYNGKLSPAVKRQRLASASSSSDFSTFNHPFSCYDEISFWNKHVTAAEVQKMYDAVRFNGKQASRHAIQFKEISANEPYSVWGLDLRGKVYTYHNATWMLINDSYSFTKILSGISGVFAVSAANQLHRRAGVTPQHPIGTSWVKITLDSGFEGAITEVTMHMNGKLLLKGTSKWHCVNSAMQTNKKPVSSLDAYSQAACSQSYCWVTHGTNKISARVKYKADPCEIEADAGNKKVANLKTSRLAYSTFTALPVLLKEEDKRIYQCKRSDGSACQPENYISYANAAALNGVPVGITSNGELDMLKAGIERRFLIRHISSLCWRAYGGNMALSSRCDSLFVWRPGGCLYYIEARKYIGRKVDNNVLVLKDQCEPSVDSLKRDGSLHIVHSDSNKCAQVGDSRPPYPHVPSKTVILKWGDSCTEKQGIFFFEPAGTIKNLTSHYMSSPSVGPENGDVQVEVKATMKIYSLKWMESFSNPLSQEALLVYGRFRHEFQQHFAGNVNYRRAKFSALRDVTPKSNASPIPVVYVECTAWLHFGHFGEDERSLIQIPKFEDTWSDCAGFQCKLNVVKVAGVDLQLPDIRLLNTSTTEASLIHYPSSSSPQSAFMGYNVSCVGTYRNTLYIRSMYRQYILKAGDSFVLQNLLPYFNYSCSISLVFVQGVSPSRHVTFQTQESAPSEAPNITCSEIQQHALWIDIADIDEKAWQGKALGYRMYFKSVLKLPYVSYNISDIQATYDQVDFLVATFERPYRANVTLLEVFTNYSIAVAAFTKIGIGPFNHLFCRTSEGAPEVAPAQFNATALNATHIMASWAPLTTDIELLNAWFLSSYTVKATERSQPVVSWPLQQNWTVPANQTEFVLGPFEEARQYELVVAGSVNGVDGVNTSLCVSTDEAVPSAAPLNLSLCGVESTSVTILTGNIPLISENGKILYYSIAVEDLVDNIVNYNHANITMEHRRCANNSRTCDADFCITTPGSIPNRTAPSLISHVCSTDVVSMPESSTIIKATVNSLLYWTNYSISVAACNSKGCGNFSHPVRAQTDAYKPLCPPLVSSVGNSSSTSLSIEWEPLQRNCSNGLITHYYVFVVEHQLANGTEWFNVSESWNAFDGERYQNKFYTNSSIPMAEVTNLKKYMEYCVSVQAVNVKGFGPASPFQCAYTDEDIPEGPPVITYVSVKSSTKMKIALKPPAPNVTNGILLGYEVFFTRFNGDATFPVEKITVDKSKGNFTKETIRHLKKFTWYSIHAAAFTVKGLGPQTVVPFKRRTREDAPTAPPSHMLMDKIRGNSSVLTLQKPAVDDMHGIFTRLVVNITEFRRNGAMVTITAIGHISNSTAKVNGNGAKNQTNSSLAGNATANWNSTGSSPKPASTAFNIANVITGGILNADWDIFSEFFSVDLSGLLPFTDYNVSASVCTKIGCGPSADVPFMTEESTPTAGPEVIVATMRTNHSLTVTWSTVAIMEQNGVILSYRVKWMKNCLYLRKNRLAETPDCVRVLPSNQTEFASRDLDVSINSTTVDGLDAYTNYLFEICASTSKGYGTCSNTTVLTEEGVPCQPPNVTDIYDTTGKSIMLHWNEVVPHCQNGVILGYNIFYKKLNPVIDHVIPVTTSLMLIGNYTLNVTSALPRSRNLENLALRTNYSFIMSAFTSKGAGPNSTYFFMATGDFKHGNWSEWSEWSYCSKSCGGGTNTKTRLCNNPAPFNGGDDCKGPDSDTKTCNTQRCSGPFMGAIGYNCTGSCATIGFYCKPQYALQDSTATFKELGLKCKDEETAAKWSQNYHPSFRSDGRCEGYKSVPNEVPCNATAPDRETRRLCNCVSPDDCGCENWAPWGICSKSCGGGIKARKRKCEVKSWCPPGRVLQQLECGTTPCPVDGNWGAWGSWLPCNKSCGYGFQHRYRKCDSPEAAYGGDPCPGPSVDVLPECNAHKCPVHGNWGEWGEWRNCNQPCGGGTSIRRRYCDNPSPKYLGRDCSGPQDEGKLCNPHKCEGVEVLFQIKLVDFTWDYKLVYKTNPKGIMISNELVANVRAAYNNSDDIRAVNIINFYEGSVVANFTIFYQQVKAVEILLLQDTIATTGKLFNLSTVLKNVKTVSALSDPPTNLTAVSKDPFSMYLTWLPPPKVHQVVNISGYYVFYREFSSSTGQWQIAGVPGVNSSSFNLTDLKAFTKYRLRMTLAVKVGNGPGSQEVVASTIEGVPSAAPTNLTLTPSSSGGLRVEWTPIPAIKFNGRNFGYKVKYRKYVINCVSCKYVIETVPNGINEITLTDVRPFTLYEVEVEAYSGAGSGLPVAGVVKTPEGAPDIAPPSVSVKQLYSTSQLLLTWKAIPNEFTNGILQGYRIQYTVTHVSNSPYVGATPTVVVKDRFTFLLKINGLQSYTKYSIKIAGFTNAGNGPASTPISGETCKCPSDIFLNYYVNPPYVVKLKPGKITGLVGDLVQNMIKSSCGKCNNIQPTAHLTQSLSGEDPEKKNELEVKQSIGTEFHASFPIFGRSTVTKYMEYHIFVLFVESSGSATVVRNEVDYAATTTNVFNSIANIWPMYLVILVFTTLAGILIWGAERSGNDEFSRGNFVHGMFQGFWWAYISMTTVGYGDIVPRTFWGRVFTIIWTLAGLVLSGILLGSLTSSVTTMTLPPAVKLYGTECAAVNDSFEAYLGVRRNSKVNTKQAYQTTTAVLDALKSKQVNIALIDAFAAATLQEKLKSDSLKVSQIISANTGYGVVLSNDFVRLENDFRSFVASNQDLISSFISNMSNIDLSDTVTEVPMLFDPTTDLFWEMIKAEGYMLLILSIFGLCWSFYLTARKRRAKVMSNQEVLLRKMESLDENVDQFQETVVNKLDVISRRHGEETSELLRLKKSYKRYTKRKNRGFDPLREHASPRGNEILKPTETHVSINNRKYAVKDHTTRHSDI